MPGSSNAETYLARAQMWRKEAETLPPGKERDAYMALAEGYADLAALIKKETEGRIPCGQPRRSAGVLP
jgi:hypothetical protein